VADLHRGWVIPLRFGVVTVRPERRQSVITYQELRHCIHCRFVQLISRMMPREIRDCGRTLRYRHLGLAQTRYKLGLSSIVELSQAQLQSTEATFEVVNARFDYLLALRLFDYARGQLAP
jgi:hypothetical protein